MRQHTQITYFISLILFCGMQCFLFGHAQAQNREPPFTQNAPDACNCPENSGKLSFMVFGGGNTLYQSLDNNFIDDFEVNNLDWQAGIMLGIRYGNRKEGTTVALFAHAGNTPDQSLSPVFIGNSGTTLLGNNDNPYYQLEGGVLLFDVLRLSAGAGRQEFTNSDEQLQRLYYYSATTGLHLGGGNLRFLFDLNFAFGRNLEDTAYRPSIGLGLRF